MAIMAILAALLLSALAKSKGPARSVACKSSRRQMGFALRMYPGDVGRYPGNSIIRHGPKEYDKPPNIYAWSGRIASYIAAQKVDQFL